MQNIVSRPFSLYGSYCLLEHGSPPTKTKQLSELKIGKPFLIYINFLLDYLI